MNHFTAGNFTAEKNGQKAEKTVSSTGLEYHICINFSKHIQIEPIWGKRRTTTHPQAKALSREECTVLLSGFDSQFSVKERPAHHLFALKVLVLYITTHLTNRQNM